MILNRYRNEDAASLIESELLVPPGGRQTINVSGDFFYIESIGANIPCSMNGGKEFTAKPSATFQGEPGRGEVATLIFRNNTGSTVVGKVQHGLGRFSNPGSVVIANPSFTLDAATVAAINPPDVAVSGAVVSVTNNQTFNDRKMLSVYCRSGTVTVQTFVLNVGESQEFPFLGRGFKYGPITVNGTGGEAVVTHVG